MSVYHRRSAWGGSPSNTNARFAHANLPGNTEQTSEEVRSLKNQIQSLESLIKRNVLSKTSAPRRGRGRLDEDVSDWEEEADDGEEEEYEDDDFSIERRRNIRQQGTGTIRHAKATRYGGRTNNDGGQADTPIRWEIVMILSCQLIIILLLLLILLKKF